MNILSFSRSTAETRISFFRSMRGTLLLLFLAVSLIPLIAVAGFSMWQAQTALQQQAYDNLEAVHETKRYQVESYFQERQGDIGVLVDNVDVLRNEAFAKLEAVQATKKNQLERFFAEREGDAQVLASDSGILVLYEALTDYHDEANVGPADPFPVDATEYLSLIAPHEEHLANYIEIYGYYDVFLICAAHGHVMYTGVKESDLGANLSSGALQDSGLAEVWRQVKNSGQAEIVDFKPYAPSGNAQVSFIGAPVRDQGGQMVGVVAFQIPVDQINAIVQERSGMGQTGESYLVGKLDGQTSLRSNRVAKEGKIGDPKSGPDVDKALSGETGIMTKIGSTGDM
ncbi:MAG: hypothetical protein GY832_41675, partial [Chloroflexi bacterium]|nr:hypothetical protein [Chloroflexota bacterium]